MRAVLAVIGLALLGLLFLQWRSWPPALPAPPPGADAAPAAAASGEAPPKLPPVPPREDYASVAERPLFLPDRRPPPEEPEDASDEGLPEEPAELKDVDFSAVVITPDAVKAWVTPYSQERRWLRIGDEIDGWTLTRIGPDSLVLERQGETNEILLRDYANAPAPIPPTPPPHRQRGQPPNQETPGRRDTDGRRTVRQPSRPVPTRAPDGQHGERAPPAERQQPPRSNAQRPVRLPRDVR